MSMRGDLWSLLDAGTTRGLERTMFDTGSGPMLHAVERAGQGDPVIMLHGIWGWWGYWRSLLAADPAPFGVRPLWMLDLRGHGDSSKPATGYALDDYANDIIALIEGRGASGITLVGHSLGALVALIVAARRPGAIGAVVLEDPPLPPRPGGTDAFRGVYELKKQPLSTIAEELRFWQPGTSERQSLESAMCLQATANGVFTATFEPSSRTVDVPVAGVVIDVPALVIRAGDPDARALRAGGEELLRAVLPLLEVATIDGTSHTVLRDAPEEYARVLATFLNSHA